jgi:hypothetical protein
MTLDDATAALMDQIRSLGAPAISQQTPEEARAAPPATRTWPRLSLVAPPLCEGRRHRRR